MKLLLAVLGVVLCLLVVLLALDRDPPRHPDASPATAGEGDGARERIAQLEKRIDELDGELQRLRGEVRHGESVPARAEPAPETSAPAAPNAAGSENDPRWLLARYVESFDSRPYGSEHYRREVERYAFELVVDIGRYVRDDAALPALRTNLVAMFADARFAGNARALDAVLAGLFASREDQTQVQLACLKCLATIGDERTGWALEKRVWELDQAVRPQAFQVIAELADDGLNDALRRMFLAAPTTSDRKVLLNMLDRAAWESALELLRTASTFEEPVRLDAARATVKFKSDPFLAFVDQWLAVETNPEVRAVLEQGRAKMSEPASWSAMQAAGAPNAPLGSDSPNAWTYQDSQGMGLQWLQLEYDAIRAERVRVHVNLAPGAIARIELIDEGGRAATVFAGDDPHTAPGVCEFSFARTGYRVRSVRITLDTDRVKNWSEIDAVELVGPDGSRWAKTASASNSYGERP